MSHEFQAVRSVPERVTGQCIDCHKRVSGQLGVRFINKPEGPSLEVCVSVGGQTHTLCRVPQEFIPTVNPTALE